MYQKALKVIRKRYGSKYDEENQDMNKSEVVDWELSEVSVMAKDFLDSLDVGLNPPRSRTWPSPWTWL